MKKGCMTGIYSHFNSLQPVTFKISFKRKTVRLWRDKTIEVGQGWCFSQTHISKNYAINFLARIRLDFNFFTKITFPGFCWLFQAYSIDIKEPSVKRTSNTAIF